MEFKVLFDTSYIGQDGTGINRIRLEFKDYIGNDTKPCLSVLIESDWNLKHEQTHVHTAFPLVLIESDWNLKWICKAPKTFYISVLIESDWNLKDIGCRRRPCLEEVLIESDWNLKSSQLRRQRHKLTGINRIRLEFKVFIPSNFLVASLWY